MPNQWLRIDGAGASLSAFALTSACLFFSSNFGLKASTLGLLAGLAWLLACWSLGGYRLFCSDSGRALRLVALANLAYATLTIVLLMNARQQVRYIGWLYFGAELAIVIPLTLWELRVARSKAASIDHTPPTPDTPEQKWP